MKHKVSIGDRFGRLLVSSEVWSLRPSGKRDKKFICQCDCGGSTESAGFNLATGWVRSCGCYARELALARFTTHGNAGGSTRTSEYKAWRTMKQRCLYKNHIGYANYGGRGIAICDRWIHSFENFLADMGRKPSTKHSLDRKDVNMGYCKDNCKWSTIAEQNRNKRNSKIVDLNGQRKTLLEWCELTGQNYQRAAARLRLGWSAERALTEPTGMQGPPRAKDNQEIEGLPF